MSFQVKKIVSRSRQLGQGMTEYIVITALVALAAIGAFNFFGETIQVATVGMSAELVGKKSVDIITAKQGELQTELGKAETNNSLGTYGIDNNQQ